MGNRSLPKDSAPQEAPDEQTSQAMIFERGLDHYKTAIQSCLHEKIIGGSIVRDAWNEMASKESVPEALRYLSDEFEITAAMIISKVNKI